MPTGSVCALHPPAWIVWPVLFNNGAPSRHASSTLRVFERRSIASVRIYTETWSENWGFLPLLEAEAEEMAKSLQLVVHPGLMRFATVGGELAAVLGALPDPYVPLRPRWNRVRDSDWIRVVRLLRMRKRIPVMRLMFFGVRPRFRNVGLDAILYQQVQSYAFAQGYRMCEPSMLLEDNNLILRASARMGGERYKTWRVFEMPLS